MRLMKCCCCISLQMGTVIFGSMFGILDFCLGCIGVYMLGIREMPHAVIIFFDKMDARQCVFWFSVVFYCMSASDILLICGALAENPTCMGPWLILNVIVLVCTIATALLSTIAIIRIVKLSIYNDGLSIATIDNFVAQQATRFLTTFYTFPVVLVYAMLVVNSYYDELTS